MRSLKEQNPILILLAIIGICAILYGGWTFYRQRLSEQQENAIRYGSPPAGVSGLNKPSTQPPPQ
jgi:hypothetical protein